MKKKAVSGIISILLSTSLLTLALRIQPVIATPGIFIRADGAVDPSTAPIRREGNVYTFTNNIFDEIIVEKSNIIVNGNGYTLHGSRKSENGFRLEDVNNVTIQNTNIQSFTCGVYIHGSSGNAIVGNNIINNDNGIHLSASSNNTISENNITNSYLRGIEIYSSSEANTISRNNLTHNFRSIFISGSSGNTFLGNTITGSDYDGICIYWAPDNAILGNTITNCNYDGICLYWANGNTISGNTLTENYHNIALYSSSNNTISGNTIKNSSTGIDIYSASESNTISGNTITNNDNGIHIYSTSNNTLSGNSIIGNNHGVHIYTASNNTISGNTMANNDYGVHLSHSTNNKISENTIKNNNHAGIYLYDSSEFNIISGNTIENNNQTGIYFYWSPNNTISENNIKNNNYDGIYFYWSNNNTISENNIKNNFRGIFFWSSHGNTISGNTNTENYDGICVHGADNTIAGNTLTNNNYGIALHGSGTIICGNTIKNNNKYGISLYDSSLNRIFHNNLIDNQNQIRLSHSDSMWNLDYPFGGNYWSNYNGTDSNSDGAGDAPHIINENNQDNYPLTTPVYKFKASTEKSTHHFVYVSSNSIISNFYVNPSEESFLRFAVTKTDAPLGFCRITLPKELAPTSHLWTITANGQAITPNTMEDDKNIYLYFNYSRNTKTVKIQTKEANPEFPIWIPMLLSAIVLAVAVAAFFKRKITKK